jgi:hypothetical protein
MAESTLRNAEQRVEFGIRRGDDDRFRPHLPKQSPLDDGKTLGVDMLDRLNEDGTVESADVRTDVRHRPVYQFHLRRRPAVGNLIESGSQTVESILRKVDADDPLDACLTDEAGQERAIAAAEVQQCARGNGAHNFMDRLEALFVQKSLPRSAGSPHRVTAASVPIRAR